MTCAMTAFSECPESRSFGADEAHLSIVVVVVVVVWRIVTAATSGLLLSSCDGVECRLAWLQTGCSSLCSCLRLLLLLLLLAGHRRFALVVAFV